ncbi:IS66 family transposase, partial [Candidatus Woesearchaeota archaeon]
MAKKKKVKPSQKKRKKSPKSINKAAKQQKYVNVDLSALQAIVAKTQAAPLKEKDRQILENLVDTFSYISSELKNKTMSLNRLRRFLFGASTEKLSNVLAEDTQNAESSGQRDSEDSANESKKKKAAKGHGRNSAKDFKGAKKVAVSHSKLKKGDKCPKCEKGKLYPVKKPSSIVRVSGMAPLGATVYELEKLRCNLCGHVFTADPPDGVGTTKYDESAASMMAILKYGCGLPFNRLERLESNLGIPLPASTQWDVLDLSAHRLKGIYDELIRQAAQGKVLHNDDTVMKILDLKKESQRGKGSGCKCSFTSSIVSIGERHQIALFLTGKRHAGQNLADVLAHRNAELPLPVQMCDCLDVNTAGDFASIVSHCLIHARRNFIDCEPYFPEECEYILKSFADIYKNEKEIKEAKLSDQERLRYHQEHSKEILDDLELWMAAQFDCKLVEPNSALGKSLTYMLKRWDTFTLFLEKAGVPLDNNIC